ncbi:uncharacterized protein LOC125604440 [Brassica napus]|uniref:uncharacterized protein LOC125604440 n=1 Tax=Brassica napus TaxID=3708 RepID=UPI0020789BB8|nr:uncharacterized protein LOC125604440 [Brassica napus]
MLSTLGLHDIKTIGGNFTWIGKRSKYSIMSRIDRAVANSDWLEMYPTATVTLLPWIGSDHRPLLLNTEGTKWKKVSLFRYDMRWRLLPDFNQVIEQAWNQDCANVTYGDIHAIINKCRKALSIWRSKKNTNSQKVIEQLKMDIQKAYEAPAIDYVHLQTLKAQLQLQYRLEEEYWRTKSRILWLQAGDKNTKFFHAKTKQRRSYNRILHLHDEAGKHYSTVKDIHSHILTYFRNLYTRKRIIIDPHLMNGIPLTVTEDINKSLTRPVTEKEIKDAVFAMNPEKTPGPDGMTAAFYRQHWEVIKPGVLSYINLFFEQSYLDPRINETHICLIPKIENPITIKDYRPISLANVAYKIISKILAERLKPWLHNIITENQSAFIPGRLITDNVLISHELMHSLHTKNLKNKFMALKLDIAKAFDKVEWSFIDLVMEKMGFCRQWRDWIMKCISTVSYSVLINGEPSRTIKPQRGLRQGDPISPYLYIICTEGLSRLIKQNIQEKKIHGFQASRSGPPISHLLFADDSLLFCKATEEEAINISKILKTYQKASGQEVNYNKSAISFGKAGKEVLLKAVITALPAYTMSCFLLPKVLIQEITKAMRRFWWSANKDKHSISWIAWDKITASKKEGGLGIRDMMAFNKALLAKQVWRLITQPSSLLARVYKAKYYRKTNILDSRSYQTSSFAWRSLVQTFPLITRGLKWIIGDGQRTRVWFDNWLPGPHNVAPVGPASSILPNLLVKDLLAPCLTRWDISKLRALFHPEYIPKILSIRLSITGAHDTAYWMYSKTGAYTVKTGYHIQKAIDKENAHNQVPSDPVIAQRDKYLYNLWNLKIPPKIKLFWWKCIHNGLPVAENLNIRGCRVYRYCQLCGEEVETVKHMLFGCRVAREAWKLSLLNTCPQFDHLNTTLSLLQELMERMQQGITDTLPFYLGWRLWKMCNKLVYENKRDHITQVIHAAIMDKQLWEEAQNHNSVNNPQHSTATQSQIAFPLSSFLHSLPQRIDHFCIVDASWKSPEDQAGIGWSLTSIEGTPRFQGSSAIEPTSSSLVAEAMAMLLAVQQAQTLRYDNVTFIGNCGELFKCLRMEAMDGRMHATYINEATSIVKDIVSIAKQNSFSFLHVPRHLVVTADQLAKKARWNKQQYVITWY